MSPSLPHLTQRTSMRIPFVILFFLFRLSLAWSPIGRTIIVDQTGCGNFNTIQQAVNSVPSFCNNWTQIFVNNGVYNEKVEIPIEKQRVVLMGEEKGRCTIQTDEGGVVNQSWTFSLYADYFVAINIVFKNTHNLIVDGRGHEARPWKQAPAAQILGDKAAFFNCSFISFQDTLSDLTGRHYFKGCYIQGAIDFIWGYGQSFYRKCLLNVTAKALGVPGYITAQGRSSSSDPGGFVFSNSAIVGDGKAFLGRAYGMFSRVVFQRSYMSDVVVPEGWDAWNHKGQEDSFTYAELNCVGEGSQQTNRVKWEKQLTATQLLPLTSLQYFINSDGWLQTLPSISRLQDACMVSETLSACSLQMAHQI